MKRYLNFTKEKGSRQTDTPKALTHRGPTNNNVFIGSTAELQKMLRDENVIDASVELPDE